MKLIRKSIGITVALLLISVFLISLAACSRLTKEEVAFGTALENTLGAADKSINTTLTFSAILYGADGSPMRISQQMTLQRVQKGDTIYVKGDFSTSEYNLSSLLKTTLALALLQAPQEIRDYLNQKAKGTFELGIKDGTINARGDIHKLADLPDFKFAFQKQEYDMFVGASLADIYEEQQNMDFDFAKDVQLLDMLMQPLLPSVDFSQVENQIGNKISKGGQYQYKFNVDKNTILDKVYAEIEDAFNEVVEKQEDEEFAERLQEIYAYYETVQSWISLQDILFTGTADEQGRLINSLYDTKLTIKVPDADIMAIALGLDIADESDVNKMLSGLHGFITSTDGVKDITEVSFIISVQESFDYNPLINLDNAIFTPLSSHLEQRTVLKRETVEGKEDRQWQAYGGSFGQ